MDLTALARGLSAEARRADERRLLVLSGDRERAYDRVRTVLDAVDVGLAETTLVGPDDRLACEQILPVHADRLLGATREAIVFDAHEAMRPNVLGRVIGAVQGGGLFVLLCPTLSRWPDRRDAFDHRLAAPPFDVAAVTGRFRTRLVETLRTHPGVAIVDVDADADAVERDGLTDPLPRSDRSPVAVPEQRRFPAASYEACLTADQAAAVRALERLHAGEGRPPQAVVVEADRGRGKSSAAGLAAASLAAEGADVLVTAPTFRSAEAAFDRARELLSTLAVLASDGVGSEDEADDHTVRASGGGRVRFAAPTTAAGSAADPDAVIVDEAAALSVGLLEEFLAADRVAFATTVHGYEGAGRGFTVRFRDRLEDAAHELTDVHLVEPIRYAAGDPIESWAFRALALDARPPVEQLVADAMPETVSYRALDGAELAGDEHLLRETFGLLVLAHYRTDPDDLARLLDAPNLAVRALTLDGHVVSVALLAREGGLSADLRAEMYEGGRVRGNMLPDVLTSQLRDEAAAVPEGLRVMRIATHHAARSRGLGSRLLAEIRAEWANAVDWLGVGYGATAELLSFWADNGYGTIHLSTTRNETSGEYSALMIDPTSEAGRELYERHSNWFARRIPGQLSDALDDCGPDVVRAALAATDADLGVDLSPMEWRTVAGAAYGPGLFDVAPHPFRELVATQLIGPRRDQNGVDLTERQERLLVERVLQARDWSVVADDLGYHSPGQCMRALGEALEPLVDAYGDETARAVRERFE